MNEQDRFKEIAKVAADATATILDITKNAGIPPEVFDKLWDEYEGYEYKRRKDYGAVVARYADPEVTEAFEKMDKEENE